MDVSLLTANLAKIILSKKKGDIGMCICACVCVCGGVGGYKYPKTQIAYVQRLHDEYRQYHNIELMFK